MNPIVIRKECPSDYKAVLILTYEAFVTLNYSGRIQIDEHYLYHLLQNSDLLLPELNFVAELDGKIVGHILYTKSKVENTDGSVLEVATFGPLSVHPDYQRQGIGKALVHHSMARAKELGFQAVLITGVEEYYQKLGFKRAEEYGLKLKDGTSPDYFMVYELVPGTLKAGGVFSLVAPELEKAEQDTEGYTAFHRAFMQEFFPNQVKLRSFLDGDFSIMEQWLDEEHVKPWYQPKEDWLAERKERYTTFSFITHFIAELNGIPIGFCQYYDMYYGQEYEEWHTIQNPGEIYSIDYLIGNPAYLKKGYGKTMILLMLEKLRKLGVKKVIVGPDKENTPSNNTLKSCGFVWDGEDYIMELNT
jgi:predicted N-acetyltransferase YhbS